MHSHWPNMTQADHDRLHKRESGVMRWTMVKRGERMGSRRPDYVWWHELPEDTTADAARSVGYPVVEMVSASFTEEDVERVAEAIRAYHAPQKPCPQLWERGLARAALSAFLERGRK